MKLRPIQNEAIDHTIKAFCDGGTYHLLQAPVGWGKTIFASALMSMAVRKWGAKCLFLAHLKELVVQTVDKFEQVDPELSCGMVMGKDREICDVTIGTRQTVGKNLDLFGDISLIIIDEVHLYGAQYQKIVDYFASNNPRLRVLGVTGTPFSLKDGWIYGERKLWSEPCHSTTMDAMIDMGYLSPYRYKMAEALDEELSQVKKTAGEFNEGDLGEMMQEEHHLGTVKNAISNYGEGRKSILIFAVTIEHAEKLAEFLGCAAVHSKLEKNEWRSRVDSFKSGKVRMLVNVSQLSIGFDAPRVDCVVIARPTMSPALHTQICGRGLRIMDGKEDCLFLDLVGNYLRHGLPSNPKVRKPKEKQDDKEETEAKSKVCHECFEIVEGEETICPSCGAELTAKKDVIDRNEELKMLEIERERNAHKFVRWWEKDKVSKQGYAGVLFCVKITGRDLPLFKNATNGTAKQEKIRDMLMKLEDGQIMNLVDTAYGPWFS
tara:strand:+ start:841 stop:2310 length:1470 start_codon:yes stop_codon:yes gene_type:complete